MSRWSSDELARVAKADELRLESQRQDGSLTGPVTIWVVRDGDDLYVRSGGGRAGKWFRRTQVRHEGHINSGGVDRDVEFVLDSDPALNERIDSAYRNKYRRYPASYVDTLVSDQSREATLKLVPH